MMRDVDASEKKKKMLPYFCEENYTGQVVQEVSVLFKRCIHRCMISYPLLVMHWADSGC
jgi:hypothetical protein